MPLRIIALSLWAKAQSKVSGCGFKRLESMADYGRIVWKIGKYGGL